MRFAIFFVLAIFSIIIPLLFVSLGFYRPTLPDVLKATVFLLGLLIVMECVNLLFSELNKLTGGTKIANFFYTRTGEGTAVLEICWNWIGIELVYLLPLAVIAVPLFAIYYSPKLNVFVMPTCYRIIHR